MKAKIQVYDKDIHELIEMIDIEARAFDKGKYGIPPINGIKCIIYHWLHLKDEENKK